VAGVHICIHMVMRDGQDVAVMRGHCRQAEGEERDAREWPELCKGLLMCG
jgi:hypothetical protein